MTTLSLMEKYYLGYSTETSLLQTYRTIFLGLEAILFAGAFALFQLPEESTVDVDKNLMYVISGIGCFFLVIWGVVCEGRSRRAEKWRREITSLSTRYTPAAKFRQLSDPGWPVTVARWTLNAFMPFLLACAWFVVYLAVVEREVSVGAVKSLFG